MKANAIYNGVNLTGKYVAWATSMQLDSSGDPYLGFVVVDNLTGAYGDNLEYYYAHFNGSTWQVSRVGYAGYPLYNGQNQYAGLIAVDPIDPDKISFRPTSTRRPGCALGLRPPALADPGRDQLQRWRFLGLVAAHRHFVRQYSSRRRRRWRDGGRRRGTGELHELHGLQHVDGGPGAIHF